MMMKANKFWLWKPIGFLSIALLLVGCAMRPVKQMKSFGNEDEGPAYLATDIAAGTFDTEYTFSFHQDGGRVFLDLTPLGDRAAYEVQLLDLPGTFTDIQVVDEQWLGKMQVEGVTLQIVVTAKLLANRWLETDVQVAVIESDQDLVPIDAEYVALIVSGPEMPYRFLPSNLGLYGPIPPEEMDGNWHSTSYPNWAYAPSIAAFDRQEGILVTSIDEHVFDGQRRYQLAYMAGQETDEIIGILTTAYHGETDTFGKFVLGRGESIQLHYVIEPVDVFVDEASPLLVDAEVRRVIDAAADQIHAYLLPVEIEPLEERLYGHAVMPLLPPLVDWDVEHGQADLAALEAIGATMTEDHFADGTLNCGGTQGIGCEKLKGGSGPNERVLQYLETIDQRDWNVAVYNNLLIFRNGESNSKQMPECIARDEGGEPYIQLASFPNDWLLDIRQPDCYEWIVEKMVEDIVTYPMIDAYRFDTPYSVGVLRQRSYDGKTFEISYPAAAANLYRDVVDSVLEVRPEIIFVFNGSDNLLLADLGDMYANGDGVFDLSYGEASEDPPVPLSRRMSTYAKHKILGAWMFDSFGGCNLSLVGMTFRDGMRNLTVYGECAEAGLGSWESLFAVTSEISHQAGGYEQLREDVLYSSPGADAETGELPCRLDELVTASWLQGADGKTAVLVSAFATPWDFELVPPADTPAGLFAVPFGNVEQVVGENGEVLSLQGHVAEDDVLAGIVRPIVVKPLDGDNLRVAEIEWRDGYASLEVESGREARISVRELAAGEMFELVVNGDSFLEKADEQGEVVVEIEVR